MTEQALATYKTKKKFLKANTAFEEERKSKFEKI